MAVAGYRVTGRVQGVGFRWWTRSLATRLALTGTVRNTPDGALVVYAQGEPRVLGDFHVALARGPVGSHVDAVEEITFTDEGMVDGAFTILR